jgi:hypothetical protein
VGSGSLAADACDAVGLELPPLGEETAVRLRELLRPRPASPTRSTCSVSATAASYEQALPIVLDDPHVDAALVLFVPAVSATAEEVANAVDAAARAAASGKPRPRGRDDLRGRSPRRCAPARPSRRSPIPSRLPAPSAGSRIAPSGCDGPSARRPRSAASTGPPRLPSSNGRSRGRRGLVARPAETRALLGAYGLPLVPELVAETRRRRLRRQPSSASGGR